MIVVRKQVYERRRPVNASRIVVTCPSRMVLQALTLTVRVTDSRDVYVATCERIER